MRLTPARKISKSLQAELEPVEVEGWPALAFRQSLEPMGAHELPGSVVLLPPLDAYVMGIGRGPDIEPLLPKAFQPLVYRSQVWISTVVLVDGYIQAVWEYDNRSAQTLLKVRIFSPQTAGVRRGIEAERLSALLNTKVVVEVGEQLKS